MGSESFSTSPKVEVYFGEANVVCDIAFFIAVSMVFLILGFVSVSYLLFYVYLNYFSIDRCFSGV